MPIKHIYSSRITAAFLIPLGLAELCLAAALPFVLQSPILGFVLMGLPLIFAGFVALRMDSRRHLPGLKSRKTS